MSPRPERETPFESPSSQLIHWRPIRRLLRNALLLVLVIVLFVELIGEPMLRWEYRYRGPSSNPTIFNATYYGFSGRLEASAYQYADGCPLILFIRPKTPLWRQSADWLVSPFISFLNP